MTLSDVYEKFRFQKELAGLSLKSLSSYDWLIGRFISYAGKSLLLSDVTEELVNHYIVSLYHSRLSRGSVSTYVRNLRIFLQYIYKNWGLSFDPSSVCIPRSPKKKVRMYTDAQLKQIFDAINYPEPWICARNRAALALMLDSGLRLGEVCSLQMSGVTFEPPVLLVHGKGDKERFAPLGDVAADMLKEYLSLCPHSTKNNVFVSLDGSPWTTNAVQTMVFRLAKRLPFDLSAHKLRHNFATNYVLDYMEKYGHVDAYTLKSLMGHSSLSTTEGYIHCALDAIAAKSSISHLDLIAARS